MERSFADILQAKIATGIRPEANEQMLLNDQAQAFYQLRDYYFLKDFETKRFNPSNAHRIFAQSITRPEPQAVKMPKARVLELNAEACLALMVLRHHGLRIEDSEITAVQLKKAWRRLALQIHPDRNASSGAHTAFVAAHAAYRKLSNHIDTNSND